MKNLTTLDIHNNGIRAGAASLARLSQLTSLNICYNHIGPEGAASLARLSQLTTLNIW